MNFRFSDVKSQPKPNGAAGPILTRREAAPAPAAPVLSGDAAALHDYLDLKVRLHQRLIEEINLSVLDRVDRSELKREISGAIGRLIASENKPLNTQERERITDELVDELMGFGPLEPLLADDTIADILVNTPHQVYVERRGVIEETNVRFKDNAHLMRIIDRIVVQVGRRVDEGTPLVDARLPDGSRVNAVIAPVAIDGPLLSIRKFSRIPYDLDRLVEVGAFFAAARAQAHQRRQPCLRGGEVALHQRQLAGVLQRAGVGRIDAQGGVGLFMLVKLLQFLPQRICAVTHDRVIAGGIILRAPQRFDANQVFVDRRAARAGRAPGSRHLDHRYANQFASARRMRRRS